MPIQQINSQPVLKQLLSGEALLSGLAKVSESNGLDITHPTIVPLIVYQLATGEIGSAEVIPSLVKEYNFDVNEAEKLAKDLVDALKPFEQDFQKAGVDFKKVVFISPEEKNRLQKEHEERLVKEEAELSKIYADLKKDKSEGPRGLSDIEKANAQPIRINGKKVEIPIPAKPSTARPSENKTPSIEPTHLATSEEGGHPGEPIVIYRAKPEIKFELPEKEVVKTSPAKPTLSDAREEAKKATMTMTNDYDNNKKGDDDIKNFTSLDKEPLVIPKPVPEKTSQEHVNIFANDGPSADESRPILRSKLPPPPLPPRN